MNWTLIEMSIDCPECDAPVHVDGPYRTLLCSRCQSNIDFPEKVWADTLDDVPSEVPGMEPGTGSGSTIFGHFNMRLTTGNLVPYCIECKRDFNMGEDYSKGSGVITCPRCGSETPVFPAPQWFRNAIKGNCTLVVGAWPEGETHEPESDISGPVAYSCPQCAGSLRINGEDRLVECEYCQTNIYLPDDLWLRLHPVKKKTRWFFNF